MNININPISGFVQKIKDKIKKKRDEYRTAQYNFKNRKDNSNYYRGTGYWKDHTN